MSERMVKGVKLFVLWVTVITIVSFILWSLNPDTVIKGTSLSIFKAITPAKVFACSTLSLFFIVVGIINTKSIVSRKRRKG